MSEFGGFYDISLRLDGRLAGWPGDAPFAFRWTCRLADGDSVNLGEVAMSVHAGTHADAPLHFEAGGAAISDVPLQAYIGPARVVDVRAADPIRVADMERHDLTATPRLLLRTGAWPDRTVFPERIPIIAPDVPDWLAGQGVVLVGLDVPSVDALDSKELPNHHALGRRGIAILESLDLDGVPEGVYELLALPLRIAGADGSPVRAVLRRSDS